MGPNGRNVYVATNSGVTNIGGDTVSQYDVGAGGALSARRAHLRWRSPRAPTPSGSRSARTVRSLRHRLRVDDTVFQYTRACGRNTLTEEPGHGGGGDYPLGVASAPMAERLRHQRGGNSVSQYDRRGGWGALTEEPRHGGGGRRAVGDRGQSVTAVAEPRSGTASTAAGATLASGTSASASSSSS